MAIPISVLLTMRNVSDKEVRENQNAHFMLNKFFFYENLPVLGVMWENILELDRPHMTTRHIRISCRITKATNTHLEYVIFLAFPPQ